MQRSVHPVRYKRTHTCVCPSSVLLVLVLLEHRLPHPCPLLYRLLHLLPRRRPYHQLGRYRPHCRRNPWLRCPRTLVANYNMNDIRNPGGHVAKSVQCTMHHENTHIATVSCPRWVMLHWCQCWQSENQSTRVIAHSPREDRRTCQLHLHQTFKPD